MFTLQMKYQNDNIFKFFWSLFLNFNFYVWAFKFLS